MGKDDEGLAELFEQYKEEVREIIGHLDNELVAIEQDPTSSELIFSLFRHMHSLKGSSKMFHINNIAHIAHRLEDLMALIDKNNSILVSNPNIIDLLFQGNDIFREIISCLESDINFINLTTEQSDYIEQIQTQISRIQRRDGALIDAATKLLEESEAILNNLDGSEAEILRRNLTDLAKGLALATLDEQTAGGGTLRYIYSGLDLSEHVQAIEIFIGDFGSGKKANPKEVEEFLEHLKTLSKKLFEVAGEDIMPLLAELNDGLTLLTERDLGIDEITTSFFTILLNDLKDSFQVEIVEEGGKKEGVSPATKKRFQVYESQSKTIRVDEAKIDQFLDSVGKLITESEILNHLHYSFRQAGIEQSLIRDFAAVSRTISTDIVNLQKSIMEVRQVEMDNILKKFPRLVRDLAHRIDKEIELNIVGEKIPIDKSLLDDVEQALIHIVRNAVDHGIELPQDRKNMGKATRGVINIKVISEETSIYIEVSDDGRGLDLEVILQKAVERGSITSTDAQNMSVSEVEMLIFDSGVSTKDQATDISGRGVGMDVVMTNLCKWNGEVLINNRPKEGLSIGLRLPVTNTLLTKEAILFKVSENIFCLPLEFVNEIITLSESDLHRHKNQEIFRHRDIVVPVVGLNSLLNLSPLAEPISGLDFLKETNLEISDKSPLEKIDDQLTVIILRGKNNARWAIMADEILGQQKIVIKDFELASFRKLPYFSGLTLLGDGRVVLILDAEKLMTIVDDTVINKPNAWH